MHGRLAIAPSLVILALAAAALGAPANAKLAGFQSEDHKVGCYISGQGARCDVRNPKWTPPPKPADCELDWGFGVAVGRHGPADYVCAGDTTLDRGHPELAVGKKQKQGRFKCKALDVATIKCVNKRNHEGFVVSRFQVELLSR